MLSNYLIKGSGNIAQRHAINLKKNSKNNKVFFFTNNKTNKFKNFCKKNKFILNKNIENFNKEKIKSISRDKGVDEKTISKIIQLIENCESAKYSRSSNSMMNNDLKTVIEVINLILKNK